MELTESPQAARRSARTALLAAGVPALAVGAVLGGILGAAAVRGTVEPQAQYWHERHDEMDLVVDDTRVELDSLQSQVEELTERLSTCQNQSALLARASQSLYLAFLAQGEGDADAARSSLIDANEFVEFATAEPCV